MPASRHPSEYGGKVLKNGFQPENPDARTPNDVPVDGGHTLTASEQLSLVYGTGQDQDPTRDRDPAAFRGNGPRETWDPS